MKKISKYFRSHIGPHHIEFQTETNWQELQGRQPVFIFDFFAQQPALRYSINDHIAELCGINLLSLDIMWVDGQEKYLDDQIDSFWLWNKEGLIPFAVVGGDAHQGPFKNVAGILFLNPFSADKAEAMEVLLLHVSKEPAITKVASSFAELSIIKTKTDRVRSEEIKQEGNALFGQGEFEQAADKFFEAMLVDPTNPNPYNNLGMITQVTGTSKKRGELFVQLSFLVDPTYTNGMRGYSGYLAGRGKFKKAIKLLQRCVALEPIANNYSILAEFYLEAGKTNQAKEAAEKALDLDSACERALKVYDEVNV